MSILLLKISLVNFQSFCFVMDFMKKGKTFKMSQKETNEMMAYLKMKRP